MIALAPVDSLYPLVRERITGVLDFIIRKALIETAIEFCRESQLVQDTLGPVSVDTGDNLPLVPVDQPYQGRRLIRVYGDSTHDDHRQLVPGVDYEQSSGNTLKILRPYSEFNVIFVAEPRLISTQIPTVLIDDYPEAVACGAVCRLATMPSKPWSNPQMAQALHPQFVDGYRAAYRWRLENTAVNSFQNPVQRQEFF